MKIKESIGVPTPSDNNSVTIGYAPEIDCVILKFYDNTTITLEWDKWEKVVQGIKHYRALEKRT